VTVQQVRNLMLATDAARANLLTNGGFEIWQRGNGPFTANAAYTADRWFIGLGAGSSISISRDTANADSNSQYCAAVTYTHSAQTDFTQPVAVDVTPGLRGKPISCSVRVKTSVANGVRLRINPGTGPVTSAYHTGSGQYETLTLPMGAVTSATTLINFQVELSVSGTYYIDNAMLVVGSVPADYAPLHPADDLARCLRYYETISASNNQALLHGQAYVTTAMQFLWDYLVAKGVTPSITTSPLATFSCLSATGAALSANAVDNLVGDGRKMQGRLGVASGLVAGNASQVIASGGQMAVLIAEANP